MSDQTDQSQADAQPQPYQVAPQFLLQDYQRQVMELSAALADARGGLNQALHHNAQLMQALAAATAQATPANRQARRAAERTAKKTTAKKPAAKATRKAAGK